MACEECSIRFSVFKRKKQCGICLRYYCKHCLLPRRDDCSIKSPCIRLSDKKYMCRKCRILSARPLNRSLLLQLRVRDLQLYLSSQKISTRGCVEKDDLINLLLQHVNGANNVPRYATTGFHSQTDLSWREERQEQQQRSNSAEDFASYTDSPASASNVMADQPVNTFQSSTATNSCSNLGSDSGRISNDSNLHRSSSIDINSENQWSNANHGSIDGVVQQEDTIQKDTKFKACSGISLEDIKSAEEMEKLSVKQIKEILSLNRVDFRGCVEKSELIERLSRLWHDNHKSRTELDNLSLQELCKICMDAPIECVILECGHMAACMKCGKQLSECPICRQFVVRVVRTFRA
ncbi:E3 ubiquitin-protein ligase RNF34 [Schistocerca nitens]|uniref:E3 ubiquitin-protein ligase RNF34 n=1 Tax=Schistocerca nitens TaxID=7011 RepID=UPI0021181803|nr:E3 ubiquitin-protein ligase RNF34 [Schistocerca nitens]XP_049805718.1 E3 ubiquitin-protein ligase RNF34 [Schistocerca nitens]XP_049805728.1 E3 ubiquitin-protein ligase RNF34 [Schistocerca nitens]